MMLRMRDLDAVKAAWDNRVNASDQNTINCGASEGGQLLMACNAGLLYAEVHYHVRKTIHFYLSQAKASEEISLIVKPWVVTQFDYKRRFAFCRFDAFVSARAKSLSLGPSL